MNSLVFPSIKKFLLSLLVLAGLGFGIGAPLFGTQHAESAEETQLKSEINTIQSYSSTQTVAQTTTTAQPRFNFLPGDVEMLRGAKPGNAWTDPVSASVGDTVRVLFYYHNGVVNSVAHDTRLRVDLPLTQSNSLKMTSYLWSDETQYISDTVVNGQTVGQSGMTINTPTNARVEYVRGSTRWYPEGATVPTGLPDGITENAGISIGDIKGCWEYSGYVVFDVQIKGEAKLFLDKKVSLGLTEQWYDEVIAWEGDEVRYMLSIRNDGNVDASNITVRDYLPEYMTFVPGSVKLWPINGTGPVQMPDTIFTTGVSIPGTLAPGTGNTNVIYVTYKTKIADNVLGACSTTSQCDYSLANEARVYLNGVEQWMDQAIVFVVHRDFGLTIDKKVRSGASFVEQNTAKLGDEIEYQIIVKNVGNQVANSVLVRDVLPTFTTYVQGSTKIDGVIAADGIIGATGLNLGNLDCGQQKVITFKVKTLGCPPVGNYTLTNTAYTRATSVTEISDSAMTVLNISAPIIPVLSN